MRQSFAWICALTIALLTVCRTWGQSPPLRVVAMNTRVFQIGLAQTQFRDLGHSATLFRGLSPQAQVCLSWDKGTHLHELQSTLGYGVAHNTLEFAAQDVYARLAITRWQLTPWGKSWDLLWGLGYDGYHSYRSFSFLSNTYTAFEMNEMLCLSIRAQKEIPLAQKSLFMDVRLQVPLVGLGIREGYLGELPLGNLSLGQPKTAWKLVHFAALHNTQRIYTQVNLSYELPKLGGSLLLNYQWQIGFNQISQRLATSQQAILLGFSRNLSFGGGEPVQLPSQP
jgi:hypothetical protein